ncbi:MAG: DNA-3-methyladenine glycosylase I [Gammaproteobacteria bacterium]|nr:DNA-3-methyladenine glycosylase I [Gammaproteobacteria bacterium]
MNTNPIRCSWCGDDPLYQKYHDEEWGVPNYDDQHLFEMLNLEGAQAGLSWITILRKRDHYRKVFDDFDANKIASYKQSKLEQLLSDPGIVRNRLKVEATRSNAKNYLELVESQGSFSDFLWQFVDGKPVHNRFSEMSEIPVMTKQSEAMSKELKRRGFKFVGPTICYAFMQAVGMVNDHTMDCFRHKQVKRSPCHGVK